MEWVETTGRTIEEALDAALDELGVDEHDVEYEVLARPRGGLFGRFGGEARVRARVKPISREKPEGSRRRARRQRAGDGRSSGRGGRGRARTGEETKESVDVGSGGPAADGPDAAGRSRRRNRRRRGRGGGSVHRDQERGATVDEQSDMPV